MYAGGDHRADSHCGLQVMSARAPRLCRVGWFSAGFALVCLRGAIALVRVYSYAFAADQEFDGS
jgi:hypothetical protein